MSPFQFTRYLYEKDEVQFALLFSMLNKNTEESLYWAYELYYSGYKTELSNWLWKIYYDFYAILNPSFHDFLLSKMKLLDDVKTVSSIITNFIIRPYTLDVFILRQIVLNCDCDCEIDMEENTVNSVNSLNSLNTKFALLNKGNYIQIAYWILNSSDNELENIVQTVIQFFINKGLTLDVTKETNKYVKSCKISGVNKQIVLLSQILHYYVLTTKTRLGKKVFICSEDDEILKYKTVTIDLLSKRSAYKILKIAAIYSIDKENYLSLFQLKRENENDTINIVDAYKNNWEYYASFSPLWLERIQKHNGTIDHEHKKIHFDNDDDMELFYNNYGLEPDEQPKSIQEKSIQPIQQKRKWSSFYKKYNKRGITNIHEDYLVQLDKLEY